MDLSSDYQYLLSASLDGDVRLWSLRNMRCVVGSSPRSLSLPHSSDSSIVYLFIFPSSSKLSSFQSLQQSVCLWWNGLPRLSRSYITAKYTTTGRQLSPQRINMVWILNKWSVSDFRWYEWNCAFYKLYIWVRILQIENWMIGIPKGREISSIL